MQPALSQCAAIDVHKNKLSVCRVYRDRQNQRVEEVREFGTMTDSILELSDWLTEVGITYVCMESTGVYWKPVYNILEGTFDVWVVNAHHVKCVPGRKTDLKDARWLAGLFEHGLLNRSFDLPTELRDLRELTRARTKYIQQRAGFANRIQKILECGNIKLGSVASDVLGLSGRDMIAALASGETDPKVLASLARGRLQSKYDLLVRALCGNLTAAQRLVLAELLQTVQSLDESITRFSSAIKEATRPFENTLRRLETVPGVGRQAAETILSEIGMEMSAFPSADRFCAWAGLAPGNNESAGRSRGTRSRAGNTYVKTMAVQVARGAVRTTDSYASAQYRRIVVKRGDSRAIVAVAHSLFRSIYHMLSRETDYVDLGSDYFAKRDPERAAAAHANAIRRLGYEVEYQRKELLAA